ncbi:MAG: hypothetical protein ACTHOF_13140 [Flavisolibacter sp.]
MKNQSGALLYFSGYPPGIVDASDQKTKKVKANLSFIKPNTGNVKKNNDVANNPKNWDENWFGNYE